jgi:hypothetical protein
VPARIVSVILLAFLLSACGSSLPYATNYPLTADLFHSRDGTLSGKIPQGWFSSSDDTLAPSLLVWITKEDFSATLTVKELHLDRLSTKKVEDSGLKLLAYLSAGLQDEVRLSSDMAIEPKEFEIHGRKFCSYELRTTNNATKRIVVFEAHGKFYECEASSVKGTWSKENLDRLFTVQQTMLASLVF